METVEQDLGLYRERYEGETGGIFTRSFGRSMGWSSAIPGPGARYRRLDCCRSGGRSRAAFSPATGGTAAVFGRRWRERKNLLAITVGMTAVPMIAATKVEYGHVIHRAPPQSAPSPAAGRKSFRDFLLVTPPAFR